MEHASRSPRLSPEEKLRLGQKQTLQHFSENWRTIAQLPTGYGKTLTGAACYKAARHAAKANHLLWIVPRAAQAEQARVSLFEDLTGFLRVNDLRAEPGEFQVIDVGQRPTRAYSAVRNGSCEVFVATIQSLLTPERFETVMDMMSTGRWMLVADEYHHFGDAEKSVWAQTIRQLDARAACTLALSATPHRSDGSSLFGKPEVVVSYEEAVREGAVKSLCLGAHEYLVDVVRTSECGKPEVLTFTTAELLDELGIADDPNRLDKVMAKKRMKFSSKYVSPMVTRAVDRMENLRLHGIRSQMLVQAMSCFHAESICTQLKALLPDTMRVDWVGTGADGRPDDVNKDIVERQFCPPKDASGKRPWTLDVLVNVGIASEGLDCVDVTEVVFCTSPTANPTTLQTIGRAARTMKLASGQHQPVAHISVDTSSALRRYPGKMIETLFDDPKAPPKTRDTEEDTAREDRPYVPLPEKLYDGHIDVTWQNVIDDPAFLVMVETIEAQNPGLADRHGGHDELKMLMAKFEAEKRQQQAEKDLHITSELRHKDKREQVNTAVRRIANLALERGSQALRPAKERKDELFSRINGRKKSALGALGKDTPFKDIDRHYEWVIALEQRILKEGLPTWLM
jgi:superfamily II DNA or RNA helicase